jgi:hypothetical protein
MHKREGYETRDGQSFFRSDITEKSTFVHGRERRHEGDKENHDVVNGCCTRLCRYLAYVLATGFTAFLHIYIWS